jgi:hypothetical protein
MDSLAPILAPEMEEHTTVYLTSAILIAETESYYRLAIPDGVEMFMGVYPVRRSINPIWAYQHSETIPQSSAYPPQYANPYIYFMLDGIAFSETALTMHYVNGARTTTAISEYKLDTNEYHNVSRAPAYTAFASAIPMARIKNTIINIIVNKYCRDNSMITSADEIKIVHRKQSPHDGALFGVFWRKQIYIGQRSNLYMISAWREQVKRNEALAIFDHVSILHGVFVLFLERGTIELLLSFSAPVVDLPNIMRTTDKRRITHVMNRLLSIERDLISVIIAKNAAENNINISVSVMQNKLPPMPNSLYEFRRAICSLYPQFLLYNMRDVDSSVESFLAIS